MELTISGPARCQLKIRVQNTAAQHTCGSSAQMILQGLGVTSAAHMVCKVPFEYGCTKGHRPKTCKVLGGVIRKAHHSIRKCLDWGGVRVRFRVNVRVRVGFRARVRVRARVRCQKDQEVLMMRFRRTSLSCTMAPRRTNRGGVGYMLVVCRRAKGVLCLRNIATDCDCRD